MLAWIDRFVLRRKSFYRLDLLFRRDVYPLPCGRAQEHDFWSQPFFKNTFSVFHRPWICFYYHQGFSELNYKICTVVLSWRVILCLKFSIDVLSVRDECSLVGFPSQSKGFSFRLMAGLFIDWRNIVSIRSWLLFSIS